ncbi:o-succinylbenzoate--CoA ligase [Halocalculus aciditolerans]|uniref:2-succinylbenzoate-CoA ligase n=1 Tax=Halocalculus aciditolerans TaxID=1383812 RepID=A0A830F2R1_9EURY|nr:o-succinylbenzoate--CoA ligase [Halocalculus aciditolerans]GGL56969.1 2-succinylbenzoate-CoA ligase [Halocalculus aciditolerans]
MRDWLSHRVRSSPGALALVAAPTGREWTYAELDAAVDRTAGQLAALGVTADDHVGVLMETRPAFVRLVFACQRLGATLVPLNARLAPSELMAQRATADLIALVCEAETEPDALTTAETVPVVSVDKPQSPQVAWLPDEPVEDVTLAEWDTDDTMALMFTSGTTGTPKAVRLTPGNFYAAATASAFRLGLDEADAWLDPLSMYHMGGLSVPLRATLYGTTTVLTNGFEAERVFEALHEYEPTGVSLVPTMLRRLLQQGDLPDSLRFALVGGAPTPRGLAADAVDRGVPIHVSYGMTEATSQITTATPPEVDEDNGTVGRPLFGVDVTIVDDDGDPVADGESGRIVVDGPTVTPGYYENPEANADAFTDYGFVTGDVGYFEDGRLSVLNRRSDRIVSGGENVEPGEVVSVLRRHDGVADAAVVGIADPEWGERVAALVVPAEGREPTREELRAHCDANLAGFKRPRTIAFADSVPRTASGTVDRTAVRESLARAADL